MLTKKQFNVLEAMVEEDAPSQRKLAQKVDMSVGTVNKVLNELTEAGLIQDNKITVLGKQALEPYKVKRAVIVAAGFGSRLVPITLNTPKPLIRVNGVRIIDRLIDALLQAEIEEIYIVRGYLSTQFDDLLYKYPFLKFIENPDYNESNNIGSILYARKHLEQAYIFEADLLLYNKSLVKKYQYSSNYLGIPVSETDDWCLYTKNNYINKLEVGGQNCFKLVGISYWTEKDGKQLSQDVEKTFYSPGGKERFWDQVPLEYCKNNYQIAVRTCKQEDVIEIDTFNELKAIDKSYGV